MSRDLEEVIGGERDGEGMDGEGFFAGGEGLVCVLEGGVLPAPVSHISYMKISAAARGATAARQWSCWPPHPRHYPCS